MTKRCLDEGLLQAYIDGELPPQQAAAAAAHIGACDACANALAEAEGEGALFAAAFAHDDTVSVPTEILRSRIGAAVAQLEASQETGGRGSNGWSFGGFLVSLSGLFNFTPQTAAAFASLLVLVAAGVVYFAFVKPRGTGDVRQPSQEVARNDAPRESPEVKSQPTPDGGGTVNAPAPTPEKGRDVPRFVNAGYTSRRPALKPDHAQPATTPAPKETVLPGEKDYREAIASLEKTIKLGGDSSLKPSLRVDYERNIAILDSAIEQTRHVAAKNPKDKDAVGFLMSAYQSKVELLTKVADQAQVAALGR
jgi:anti-sigma factor RsiW